MIGLVTAWRDDGGFGFVTIEGSRTTAFVHARDVADVHAKDDEPRPGDTLEYELIATERGPRGVAVHIVKRAALGE